MSDKAFEEYWHRLREAELKNKEPIRVDTKYQCRLAWNARGEVEQKKIDKLEKKRQATEDVNKILMEAVEFYANEKNWEGDNGVDIKIVDDMDNNGLGGKEARQALEKLKEGEGKND